MGVKSGVNLTREEAAKKYAELSCETIKKMYYAAALTMPCHELEDELAEITNKIHGGEGFKNYRITD